MHNLDIAREARRRATDEATMLRTLNTFAVDLIQIISIEDLFWYVARNVVGRLSFVDCVLYQADEDQTILRQVAAWGEKNPFARSIVNPLIIPFGRGITGQVAQTRTAMVVDDLSEDENYIQDTLPARSEICVPLIFRDRVIGVIDCEDPQPHAFGNAELEILSTVAAMTGAKLELLAETERSAQRYRDLLASHAELTREADTRKALEARLFEARRMESIGKMTGRFAHEFNNLLAAILGNLELLESDPERSRFPRYVEAAKTAASSSARLMQDMLAFAQRTRLVPSDADLRAILDVFCRRKHVTLMRDVTLDLSVDLWKIRIDHKALEVILLKLVENAKDATIDGGTIAIRAENVVLREEGEIGLPLELAPGRYVRLTVSDTGVGISDDRLPQIFDPFFTTKPIGAGTGLGLSIARGLTMQSAGGIKVTSELGRGTRLDLLLPAAA